MSREIDSNKIKDIFYIIVFLVLFFLVSLSSLHFSVKVILASMLVLAFIALLVSRKSIDKNKLKDNIKQFYITTTLIFISLVVTYFVYIKPNLNGTIEKDILLASAFILVGITIFLASIVFISTQKEKMVQVTFITILNIGFLYMLVIPISAVPDEPVHLFTAYHTSNLMMGIDESECRKNECVMMRKSDAEYPYQSLNYTKDQIYYELSQITDNCTNEELVQGGWQVMYGNEYLFIPCATGITVGRLLHLGTVATFLLGRLFNFLFYIAVCLLAMKILPVGKILFYVILTMPLSFQQGMSFSYDCVINSVSFLVAASAFNFAYNKTTKIKWYKLLLLLIFSIILFRAKGHAYFLVAILPFVILFMNNLKAENTKQAKVILNVFVFFVVLFSLIILLLILIGNDHLVPYKEVYLEYAGAPGYTIAYLINHPIEIPHIIINTIVGNFFYYLKTFVGQSLGWLEIELNKWLIKAEELILFVSMIFSGSREIESSKRYVMVIFSLLSIACVCAGALLGWTPAGAMVVWGVQGRYFIPVALVFMLGLGGIKKEIFDESWIVIAQNCLIILLTFNMISWFFR